MANDSHACESGNRFRTCVAPVSHILRTPFAHSLYLKPWFRAAVRRYCDRISGPTSCHNRIAQSFYGNQV
ncbi:MAG TPA: hypothetical protein PLW55_19415, partial [Leptospiraceae bacterium]|nr:hypothetical protein [Leptospiraceae bacterium]